MQNKLKLPLAIAIASAVLVGCSSNKVKEVKVKPNPLPKVAQASSLVQVFATNVSATSKEDALRLRLDSDNGVVFVLDPKGEVSAYKGKQRLWESLYCVLISHS